jgi:membrane protein
MVRRLYVFIRDVLRALHAHDALTAASAMAYSFFLSLMPLLALAGYIVGSLVRAHGARQVLRPVLEATPDGARAMLEGELEHLGQTGSGLAPLVALGFLWVSSSGVHGLLNGLELVARTQRDPWWNKRLRAVVCTLAAIVGLLAMTVIVTFLRPYVPPGFRRIAVSLFVLATGTSSLSLFYRFAIKKHAALKRRAWPGAFVAVSTWLAVSAAFGAYARSLGSYSVYYGSLAAVAILLFWCWLSAITLILGAEVNAQLEGARAHAAASASATPTPAEVSKVITTDAPVTTVATVTTAESPPAPRRA